MERPLYAVCPRCGRRARIAKFIWDWEEDEAMAVVRCACGQSMLPYLESRVLKIDLNNPYMTENHFDLLVPAWWSPEMWNRVSAGLAG